MSSSRILSSVVSTGLLLSLLVIPVFASPELAEFVRRDGHGHGHHHSAPLLKLNETEVTLYHAPTPPSYYTVDWDDPDPTGSRHPGLIITHAVFMCTAFFGALPVGIALRSVRSAWHGISIFTFYGLCALGCAASGLYRKLTPNMYEGAVHSRHGYYVLFLALLLSVVDVTTVIRRLIAFVRSGEKFNLKSFWHTAVLGREDASVGSGPEYTGLVTDAADELTESKLRHHQDLPPVQTQGLDDHEQTAQWADEVHHHRRTSSMGSDRTLYGLHSSPSDDSHDTLHDVEPPLPSFTNPRLTKHIGNFAFSILERALVFAGFGLLLTGIVTYTGGCRENYGNGCLAHLIKGGIFWCYGLMTFARFLGAFSDFGWAWNRNPSGKYPSAEFVESLVIFGYGITNTWMERFGANSGDPYTAKQIQHISIALMFWFAGLVGMGIESKLVRQWLASSTISVMRIPGQSRGNVVEPPSYRASFNPFPALVIGVTGAAMSAHAQTYLFQVQIHALWGNLLVSFSVLRCLSYFFLWLGPPRSILPSRPPTEALGSFFLACGGLVFMFSTEEVTLAAMRRGRDDVMMFLNVAVAITCFAFCWTLAIVAFKGWLRSRTFSTMSYQNSA